MRSFIISLLFLVTFVVAWGVFNNYSDDKLHGYINTIDDNVIKDVEEEKWKEASKEFSKLSKDWHKYKKKAYFFFSTDDINNADYSFARCKYYIKAKDISNSTGELACLKEQLHYLHMNESIQLENIF